VIYSTIAFDTVPERQFYICFKFLVVLVLDDFANAFRTSGELQRVNRLGICRKPKMIDLLPIGFESRKQVLLATFPANIGHGLSIRFHDLEILIIHPDLSLEVLSFLNVSGNIEAFIVDFSFKVL
jgi:hypothetical protein